MISAWREIWTIASAAITRQPPPVQIFIWLGVAFTTLMLVEGVRVSFLPRRPWEDGRHRAGSAQDSSSALTAAENPEPVTMRTQRSNAMLNRKLSDGPPRRHQSIRPKIRRTSSASATAPTEPSGQSFDDQEPASQSDPY